MKIVVRSPFSQFTGYGRDGIGLVRGLLDRGHDVRLSPTHVGVPLPRDIAGLLTAPLDAPFDVALHHTPTEKSSLEKQDALAARRSILWTMWGWPDLPPNEKWVSDFAANTEHFDYIVAYEENSFEAYEKVLGPTERLLKVLGGYEAEDWKLPDEPRSRPAGSKYVFGMVGRLDVRKGVYTAYRAFTTLKERHGDDFDAILVLNTTDAVFPPQAELTPGVHVVISKALPEELRDFYYTLDTLLAPSAAESKHLPPIEALACGTPVIMSDISGHRAWATSDMVTYLPTSQQTILPGYTGGYVDPEDLADAMWEHYTNQQAQKDKAERASRTLPAMLDWTKAIERLGLATNTLL